MSRSPAADRNLLFGILALQMNFISRDALVAAMSAWALDKSKPLGRILLDQGQLTAAQLAALDQLLELNLQLHGGDAERSLQAMSAATPLQALLGPIADTDLQASLMTFSTLTRSASAGDPPAPVSNDGSRYRVLRSHARGGLGEVFVAEDTELHREVALKQIQPHRAHDPTSRGRFMIEAEITGGLEHPGIVPVYGLGAYHDGRPYYAMRFIRGDSLKKAIERFHAADTPGRDPGERAAALRGLLRRFVDVCNAIAYAHSRGVLHRDVKPANVMLGKFGETLVVDWGLAKPGVSSPKHIATADETTADPTLRPSSGSAVAGTQAGSALGTPAYMSPEQASANHDELGPASDIYSLGATLYVLLTGRKPFDGSSGDAVLDQVRQGRFEPPRQVNPLVPVALDAVCRKAMALRPADRYGSALDLAAEVERWLADEPVSAYREPWPARAARWARRHRTAVVAAGVLLATAVVALSATTLLVMREQRETLKQKGIAEKNYHLARELSFRQVDQVVALEAQLAATDSGQAARKRLLMSDAEAFRQYLDREPDDTELRAKAALVFRFTANVHRLENEFGEAQRLIAESIRLYAGLAEQFADQAAYRDALAGARRDEASVLSRLGRLREAADTLRRSVETADQLRAADPNRSDYRRGLAAALVNQSAVEHARGMNPESGRTAARAAELYRGLIAGPPDERHPYDRLLLAAALNLAAVAEREAGRPDAARPLHNEAIKLAEGLKDTRGEMLNPIDVIHFLAAFRLDQSRTWAKTPQRLAIAETNFGKVAEQWDNLARSFPRVPMYQESLGEAYLARGQLRADAGRAAEARADLEKAREVLAAVVKKCPDVPAARADLGRAYLGLGKLARTAKGADAADWLGKAESALGEAVRQAPDRARDRQSLDEVRAEMAK